MRIIAGNWRRRLLSAPPGEATRPTADRVRETLFSMLTSRLGSFDELVVLDLFAGSGALALEALSRGASRAYLAERDGAARRAIDANIALLDADARLIASDATALPLAQVACHIIFLDPPYGAGLWAPAMASVTARGWAAPGAIASIETDRSEEPIAIGWERLVVRDVGKARLTLLRYRTDLPESV